MEGTHNRRSIGATRSCNLSCPTGSATGVSRRDRFLLANVSGACIRRRVVPTSTGASGPARGAHGRAVLAGIRGRLDYLDGLGVTALWIGPVFKQRARLDTFHGCGIPGFFGCRSAVRHQRRSARPRRGCAPARHSHCSGHHPQPHWRQLGLCAAEPASRVRSQRARVCRVAELLRESSQCASGGVAARMAK